VKWLVVAGGVLLVALLLLWREVRSGDAAAPRPAAADAMRSGGERPVLDPAPAPALVEDDEPTPPGVRPAGTLAPEDDTGPIKKYSEAFWERVDETYSRRLLGFAAPCYGGGKHRKQKLKLGFRFDIFEGTVVVRDVRVIESTLGDSRMEACMLEAVQKAAFKDPNMPDWQSSPDEEETLLIRIETLKRFGPETD
jgi:hypothetical protein